MRPHLAVLAICAALAGCAARPVSEAARHVDPAAGLTEPAPALSRAEADPLALDAPMRAFVATRVPEGGPARQLHGLLSALEQARVAYDDRTRSAAAAFRERRGDCLSLAGLVVALGRELGLEARFQEVDLPPVWTRRGDTVVQSRHVNAVFDLGVAGVRVVDFNREQSRPAYARRLISDQRAVAHYHDNRAAEALLAGDLVRARRWLAAAVNADPTLAATWVNLGLYYRRQGLSARAEASYLRALDLAPDDLAAMGNLAEEAYRRGDYGQAARQLKAAIRRNPAEDTFYALLGLTTQRQGRPAEARGWFVRAEAVTRDDAVRAIYRRKLELLASPSPG